MSTSIERGIRFAALCLLTSSCFAAGNDAVDGFGIGSTATADELKNFVSPLPDGRGLPPGSGSVIQGKAIYEAQCVACHGDKLQGGLGDKLIGGRGSLVNSDAKKAPVKTIESYWPYATTVFDYVKRAMPLYTPGSLTNDEVYAISAYILSEAKIVGPDVTLDARTLPLVQMPNRNGFVADHRPEIFVPASKAPHSN
jgi:hypothetical protein